jgi:hypothetical protein
MNWVRLIQGGAVGLLLTLAACEEGNHTKAEQDVGRWQREHEDRLNKVRQRLEQGPLPFNPALPVDRGQIGKCLESFIKQVSGPSYVCPRCELSVLYEAVVLRSPEIDPEVEKWQEGDRARLCLVSVSPNCPSGSLVGRTYTATNLRTGHSWTAPTPWPTCLISPTQTD